MYVIVKVSFGIILDTEKRTYRGHRYSQPHLLTEDIDISLVVGGGHNYVPESGVFVVICVVRNSTSATHHEHMFYLVKRACIINVSAL